MTTLLTITATPGAPIACDFTGAADTPEERLGEYLRLFEHALTDRARLADGVWLSFARKPGVGEWVTDLARREAACCPFVSYDVTSDGDTITWETIGSADPAVQAILDQYIAIADNAGQGIDAMLDRLAASGTHVVETSPGHFQVQQG